VPGTPEPPSCFFSSFFRFFDFIHLALIHSNSSWNIFGGGGNVSTRNDKEWSELSLHHFSFGPVNQFYQRNIRNLKTTFLFYSLIFFGLSPKLFESSRRTNDEGQRKLFTSPVWVYFMGVISWFAYKLLFFMALTRWRSWGL
jgi:hypothetical protein